MDKNFTISVEDAADEFGIRNLMIIRPDGSVTYHVQSNRETPDFQEIGLYATGLDDNNLSRIYEVLETPEFKNMEDHWGQVVSGEVVRLITMQNMNVEFRKLISMERTAPPHYELARNTIEHLMSEVKKDPVRVLHVDVKWPDQTVQRDKIYPVVVTFSNNGIEKVIFSNPFAKEALGQSVLYIRAQRTDVDLMAMREYHYIQQDIKREYVKRSNSNLSLGDALIKLGPKSSMSFHFDIPFDWPPGEYMSQMIWEDYGNQESKSVFVGILYSSKQPIIVKGVSKPGDEQLESESNESEPDEEDDSE